MSGKNLRILLITQNFPPETVGGAIHNSDVAEYLSKLGCDIHVLTSHPTYPYGTFKRQKRLHAKEEIGNVRVTRLWTFQPTSPDPPPIQRLLQYAIFPIHTFLRLIWMLRSRKRRPDAMITSHPPEPVLLVGYLIRKMFRIPWIIEFRDLWLESAISLGLISREGILFRLSEKLRQLASSEGELLAYTTEAIRDSFTAKYKPKTIQILNPNGVDLGKCPTCKNRERSLIYLGNLGLGYNLANLVRALPYLEDRNLKLLFVGGGDRKPELLELVKELHLENMVEFIDSIPHEQALDLTSRCLIGLHSLKKLDGLKSAISIKVLEYMGCGIPFIVANGRGEIEKLANASGAGVIVEDAPGKIAEAVNKLVEDDELRRRMGRNGRRYVEQQYNKPEIIHRLYKAIVTAPSIRHSEQAPRSSTS